MKREDFQGKPGIQAQIDRALSGQTVKLGPLRAALDGVCGGKVPFVLTKPPKYRNQPTTINGQRFASKHEAKVHARFVDQHGKQNVIPQVSLPIGQLRIIPDVMLILDRYEDGSFRCKLYDAKGVITDAWKAKQNHLMDAYGISITLVKK